jgi:IS5 family transposase
LKPGAQLTADSGYQGLAKLHANSVLPKKSTKNQPLSKQYQKQNRNISRKRIAVEHVIASVKRFRILSERYRNRRKRFSLRFSLIAGICNFERFS